MAATMGGVGSGCRGGEDNMLRALCFSGKPCVACDWGGGGGGGGTEGVELEGGAAPASHDFSG